LLTGLPLTTDRIYKRKSIRRRGLQAAAALPSHIWYSTFWFGAPHTRQDDLAWPRAPRSRKPTSENDRPQRHFRNRRCWRNNRPCHGDRVEHVRSRNVDRKRSGLGVCLRVMHLSCLATSSVIMKTMNRASKPAMVAYGAVLALAAWATAALTGTGLVGIYGFGFLGMTALFTFLMWPERKRFIRNSSTARPRQSHRPPTP